MPRESAEWFVMVAGARVGPLTRVELSMQIASGTVDGDSHVWKKGMAEWQHGGEVPELHSLFDPNAPPPPPPPKPRSSASQPGGGKPGALRPVTSATSGRSGTGAVKPKSKLDDSKKGMVELDTAHFRLASLADQSAGDEKGAGAAEFDTSHFNQQEINQLRRSVGSADIDPADLNDGNFTSQEIEALKEASKTPPPATSSTIELDRNRPAHQLGVAAPLDVAGGSARLSGMTTNPVRPTSSPSLKRPSSQPSQVRPPSIKSMPPRPASGRSFTPQVALSQAPSRPGKKDRSGSIAAILVVCLAVAGLATIYFLLQ